MSGECERCGEHCLECTCSNISKRKDKINRCLGLMQCLRLVLDNEILPEVFGRPEIHLIEVIEETLESTRSASEN